MSYKRAQKVLSLNSTDCLPIHATLASAPDYVRQLTGMDPWKNPAGCIRRAMEILDIDMMWSGLPEYSLKFQDKESVKKDKSGMAYIEWGLEGSSWNIKTQREFNTIEKVLSYDPFKQHTILPERRNRVPFSTDLNLLTANVRKYYQCKQKELRNISYVMPLHYMTLVTHATEIFGWEPFMIAAALKPERFKRVIDKLGEFSLQYAKSWARVPGISGIAIHDDIAMSNGLIFRPEWYEKNVFPWYERIWGVLKKAGKKVIYVSDGDYSSVIDSLLSLRPPPDGFFIESAHMDVEWLIRKTHGQKIIFVKIDPRIMTFGSCKKVCCEVSRFMQLSRTCPGLVLLTGGAHNAPIKNWEAFFDASDRNFAKS